MSSKLLSIIIVNYNTRDYLEACLDSIRQQSTLPYEIIVVDNGSTDGSLALLEQISDIQLISNPANDGFAKANNLGIKVARGYFIALLNPDTELNNDAFKHLATVLEKQPDAGAAGPKVFNTDGSLQTSARRFPSLTTSLFGRTALLTKLFPNNPFSQKESKGITDQTDTATNVDWISGACMLVKKNVIEKAGFLDEDFFMYWEDADWCKRIHEKGFRILWHPDAKIVHHVGQSSKGLNLKSIVMFNKSAYHYYKKHYKRSIIMDSLVLLGLSVRVMIKVMYNLLKNIGGLRV